MRFSLHSTHLKPLVFCGALIGASLLSPRPARSAPAPEVRRVLGNGATVIERVDRTSPRVAISLLVRVGAADESGATAGWRRLLTDAMLQGTKNPFQSPSTGDNPSATAEFLSARDLQREAERAGGRFSASVGDDVIEFSVGGDSTQTARLMQLLLAMVRSPRLSDADIDNARKTLLDRIDRDESDVSVRATAALRGRLYRDARGELTAYGLPPSGTLDSLSALSNERIRELHRRFFGPARWIVGAAGDLDGRSVQAALETATSDAAQMAPAATIPFLAPADPNGPPLEVSQSDTLGAWVFVAYATGSEGGANAEDWPALRVLAAALGETRSARLARRLLTPALNIAATKPSAERVVVQFAPRRFRGEFVLFAQTTPQGVEGVKNVLLDEVRKLRETPLTAAELQAAKTYVRGLWPVEREALRERAYQSALAVALSPIGNNLSDVDWPSRVQKLTAADVQRAAQKYLKIYAVALILPQD